MNSKISSQINPTDFPVEVWQRIVDFHPDIIDLRIVCQASKQIFHSLKVAITLSTPKNDEEYSQESWKTLICSCQTVILTVRQNFFEFGTQGRLGGLHFFELGKILTQMQHLKVLNLTDCEITNNEMNCIFLFLNDGEHEICESLETLNLSSNDLVSDTGIRELFKKLRNLKTLDLSNNSLSFKAVDLLIRIIMSHNKSLQHLKLENGISQTDFAKSLESFACCMEHMTHLLTLNLNYKDVIDDQNFGEAKDLLEKQWKRYKEQMDGAVLTVQQIT